MQERKNQTLAPLPQKQLNKPHRPNTVGFTTVSVFPQCFQLNISKNFFKQSKKCKGLKHEVNSENTQCVVSTFPQNPQKPGKSRKMMQEQKSHSEPKEQLKKEELHND